MLGTLFIRYRHGSILTVPIQAIDNFHDASELLIQGCKLNEKIKPINDGSGWGIAVESTWYRMIQEVLDEYSKILLNRNSEWLPQLQKFIAIISRKSTSAELWEEAKLFLHENINFLSGWLVSPYRLMAEEMKVFREGGEYFYEDDKEGKIQILGASTLAEERADYIANSITTSYGLIHILLRLFAICSIERAFIGNPKQFPDYLKVVLSESDSWTSFVNWQWSIKWPYQLRISKWRPHDNYCDPDWLANDLIAFIAEKDSLWITDGLVTKKEELHEQWHKTFGHTKRMTAFALQTTLRFGDKEEEWIEFRGHIYRWMNPNESVFPTLIATHQLNEKEEDVQLRTFRFISQLAFMTDHGIEIQFWAGAASSLGRLAVNPKRTFTMQYPSNSFFELKDGGAGKLDLSLSLYREGVTSKSPYYSFLSFYKVIQLAHDEKASKIKPWLNQEAVQMRSYKDIDQKLLKDKFNGDLEKYMQLSSRNAIAHVSPQKNPTGIIDPDDVNDQRKIRADSRLVQELAKEAIKTLIVVKESKH